MLSVKPLDLGPPSQTIGGTARLEPVPPEHAAAAKRRIELEEQASLLHAPSPPSPSPPAPRPRPPEPQSIELSELSGPSPQSPPQQATSGPALVSADDAPLSALFAPLSVGVGLVFFAMGSMLTLAIDDHIMASKAVSAMSVIAPPTAPPSPTPRTQTASLPASALASEHRAGSAPVPSPSAEPVAPPPPSAGTQAAQTTSAAPVRPPPSSGPVKPAGGTKKPALPFP